MGNFNGGVIGVVNTPTFLNKITTFTSTNPAFSFNPASTTFNYLIVAGGGGSNTTGIGNGGTGAGGMKTGSSPVTGGASIAVTVGAGGGDSSGVNGSPSSISGPTPVSTSGGGKGVARGQVGGPGGSGGGGGDGYPSSTPGAGSGIPGEGNPGGPGGPGEPSGGGGGAGSAGGVGPIGGSTPGNGSASSITGSSVVYAIGGNGEGYPGTPTAGNNPYGIDVYTPAPAPAPRQNKGYGSLYSAGGPGVVVISENGGGPLSAPGIWSLKAAYQNKRNGTW